MKFAHEVKSRTEWKAWLSNATLTRGGKPRPLRLALHRMSGHDFACPDSEGSDVKACQAPCGSSAECRVAYDRCINHAPC